MNKHVGRLEGGSYFSHQNFCRQNDYVYYGAASTKFDNFGFRLVEESKVENLSDNLQAIRGGSWISVQNYNQVTCRGRENRTSEGNDGGFRLIETSSSNTRVLRGGFWHLNLAGYCRSSSRYGSGPAGRSVIVGFRIVEKTEQQRLFIEGLIPFLHWDMPGKDNTLISTSLGVKWALHQHGHFWVVSNGEFTGTLTECKQYCAEKTRDNFLAQCKLKNK